MDIYILPLCPCRIRTGRKLPLKTEEAFVDVKNQDLNNLLSPLLYTVIEMKYNS